MELDYYPTGAEARVDGHDVPVDSTDIRITGRYCDEETKRWFYEQRKLEIKRRLFAPKERQADYPFSPS